LSGQGNRADVLGLVDPNGFPPDVDQTLTDLQANPPAGFDQAANDAVNAAQNDQLLSDAAVQTIQNQIQNNPNLTGPQKAALGAALQHDQDLKTQLAANQSNGGTNTGSGTSMASGGSGSGSSGSGGIGDGGAAPADGIPAPAYGPGSQPEVASGPAPGEAAPPADSGAAPGGEDAVYGVKVIDLVPQGSAAREGLQVGDVILAINGQATPSYEHVRPAVQRRADRADVVFLNKDNGKVERIILHPVDGLIGVIMDDVRVR
jgi:hypothetical protein